MLINWKSVTKYLPLPYIWISFPRQPMGRSLIVWCIKQILSKDGPLLAHEASPRYRHRRYHFGHSFFLWESRVFTHRTYLRTRLCKNPIIKLILLTKRAHKKGMDWRLCASTLIKSLFASLSYSYDIILSYDIIISQKENKKK